MKSRLIFAVLFALVAMGALNACQSKTPDAQQNAQVATEAGAAVNAGNPAPPALHPSPAANHRAVALGKGSTILAEFSNTLKANKLKPGDKVKASLAQAVVVHGKILATVDARLVGHVTEVKAYSKADPESRIGVVFDKILLKHHKEVAFRAVVQALGPPVIRHSRVDEPDQMLPPQVLSPAAGSGGPGRSSGVLRTPGLGNAAASEGAVYTTATVGGTPGDNPAGLMGGRNLRTQMSNVQPMSGGAGIHGVFGLKNLSLGPSPSTGAAAPVVVSTKSNVKLDSGTQVVLLVTTDGTIE
ncbi:MAG TPA: hypothetical protein VLT16_01360 [Candidatus Limnocylindrales bacterium]|nr:hypothetical protein [Candidatus Limnocylindrales bacterium]